MGSPPSARALALVLQQRVALLQAVRRLKKLLKRKKRKKKVKKNPTLTWALICLDRIDLAKILVGLSVLCGKRTMLVYLMRWSSLILAEIKFKIFYKKKK